MKKKNVHNYVPEKFTPETVGLVGGDGAMGQLLARLLREDGYKVISSGERLGITERILCNLNNKILHSCDVIIFCVPISVMKHGIPFIVGHDAPRGLRGKLIMEICSTKSAPVAALTAIRGPVAIGLHPMFGPAVRSVEGKNVYITPVEYASPTMRKRSRICLEWVEEFWEGHGARIIHGTADEHDERTPEVQLAPLASAFIFLRALGQKNADWQFARKIRTPNSQLITALAGRMLRPEVAELYATLVVENDYSTAMMEQIHEAAAEFLALVRTGDKETLANLLRETAAQLPSDIQAEAFSESQFIGSALANRPAVEDFLKAG